MLTGSCVVYLALAACNAAEHGGKHPGSRAEDGSGIVDPVPSAKADPSNGTRLRAKVRTGDDGSKEYISGIWYDTERQEDCVFAPAADGKERCIPPSQNTVTLFADSACKQQIAVAIAGCAPKYATVPELSTCGSSVLHIYSIGATMNLSKVYLSVDGMCMDVGPADPNAVYYEIGAEVPASSFVASTVQYEM
jgi:hypothetical protein